MLTRLFALVFLVLAGGCAAVYPQPKPPAPTAVYLLDYGIHSSLLLPYGDGRYVEYAFGDWNYAALNHCWPNDAIGALFISYESALGRRFIELAPGDTEPHPSHPAPQHIQVIYASQADVYRVVQHLEERYQQDAARALRHNPVNDTDYAKDAEHYSWANNCNHLTARCLREMGCDVHGVILWSNFHVAQAQSPELSKDAQSANAHDGSPPDAPREQSAAVNWEKP